MTDVEDTFAFTEEYQAKVLSYMLSDPQFCSIARDALQEDQFSNKALQWFFNSMKLETFQSAVTLKEELFKAARTQKIKADEIPKFTKLFSHIQTPPMPMEAEHIQNTLGSFIRTQEVKKAILDSFDLIDTGDWDTITEKMTVACQAGLALDNKGMYYFKDLQDRCNRRINSAPTEKLATGITDFDMMLYGGVKQKQLAMVAGGTGRGKSLFLQYVARTAILLGKKVVYFTLELPEEDVAMRFDSMFSRIQMGEINLYNSEVFNLLSPMVPRFGDSLVIKEYPADEITVAGLKGFIAQLSATGFVPDLIIVDYLDLIKPHRNYNSAVEELDAITKALHGMAKALNTRIWTATQLNRAGIVMENPDETAIAGALAKLFTVDLAVFLAQTKEEREDELMRLLLVKNRNGPAGRSVSLSTDFAFMTFFREEINGEADLSDG